MKRQIVIVLCITIISLAYADCPTDYWYIEWNDMDNTLDSKKLTAESNEEWGRIIWWDINSANTPTPLPFKLKYAENSAAENPWRAFPDDVLNWNDFKAFDIPGSADAWSWSSYINWEKANDEQPDADGLIDAIVILFTDDEDIFLDPQDQKVAARTYHALTPDNPTFPSIFNIRYKDNDSISKFRGAKMTQTGIALNNTTAFRAVSETNWPTGVDQTWTRHTPAGFPDNEWHVESVLKHELGHIFGLFHFSGTGWDDSVMNFGGFRGTIKDVSSNDLQAIDYLNLRSIAPCPPGIDDTNPLSFYVSPNFPNPFNGSTTIAYELPDNIDLQIAVYNSRGRKVRTLFQGRKVAGAYHASWDGKNEHFHDVASGVYIVVFRTPRFTTAKKVLLLK